MIEQNTDIEVRGSDNAEALIEAMNWRINNYGPLDAEPFKYSRFASPAHAALDALLASDWLAERDARVRAEALLEAARGARNYPSAFDIGDAPARGDWWIRQAVGAWLEGRANRNTPEKEQG